MEAAGNFLQSHSAFLLFLTRIELSELNGLDYSELRQIIGNTIGYMENARANYTDLVERADNATYDQGITKTLMNFDYQSFSEQKSLNKQIFSEVKSYLDSGDTRGIYYKILSDTQLILAQLTVIKSAVDSRMFPAMSDLWRVNQIYAETLLFGQYTAEIFYDITGK